jgi:hypothetical protein
MGALWEAAKFCFKKGPRWSLGRDVEREKECVEGCMERKGEDK